MSWLEKISSSRKIPTVAGLAALCVSAWTAFSHPGSWEDDAYIFFRYPQNFAAGEGLAFNSGEPSFGITSVLWTLLLGIFARVSGLDVLVAAKILCVFLFSGSVLLLTRLVQRRTENPHIAWWTGFLTALCPPLVFSAVSGMEIALNLFLLSALAASCFPGGQKKFWFGGILTGLLFLTRPENILFLGFAATAFPWQIYFYSKTGLFLPPPGLGSFCCFFRRSTG